MNNYLYSGALGSRLPTSASARLRRAEAAVRAAGVPLHVPIDRLTATDQNSAQTAICGPLTLLVSYSTVVAYRHADGSTLATPRGHYSRTTDKAVDRFAGPLVRIIRVDPERFRECLREHFPPV
jgi:hypothetical protein